MRNWICEWTSGKTRTAFDVVNHYGEQQLHKLFEQYGEVTNAKTLARTIVKVRQSSSIKTIDDLKNTLRGIVKGNPNKYFAQVFQALRIEVNEELDRIKRVAATSSTLAKTRRKGSHYYIPFFGRQVGKKFFSPRFI